MTDEDRAYTIGLSGVDYEEFIRRMPHLRAGGYITDTNREPIKKYFVGINELHDNEHAAYRQARIEIENERRRLLIRQPNPEVDRLVAERAELRSQRDYVGADRIKQKLLAMGISIIDLKDGSTIWSGSVKS